MYPDCKTTLKTDSVCLVDLSTWLQVSEYRNFWTLKDGSLQIYSHIQNW